MKKNVSGQKIGAQLVSATDGSAFTGSVTAYVTGDAGTQAAGSVGSGACTHEGNGYHTYAPAQAETNYDLVAFTFTGTGAVPATVQIFTTFPQTGDSFGLIGTTGSGLTSLASQASVDTIDGIVDAILVDTAEIGVAGAGLTNINLPNQTMDIVGNITGNLSGSVGSVTGHTPQTGDTYALANGASGFVAIKGETAATLADTNELQTDWVNGGRLDLILDARASQASVDDIPTNAELATALAAADDAVLAAIGDLPTNAELATALGDLPTAAENATELLDQAAGVETNRTVRQSLRLMLASMAGKLSGAATTTVVIRDTNDSADRITATVDADGNRTAITYDAS